MTGGPQTVEELPEQFSLWEIWFVPSAVQKGGTYCANPWVKKDDRRNVLHADTAAHLGEYIEDAEAEAAHLANAERGDRKK